MSSFIAVLLMLAAAPVCGIAQAQAAVPFEAQKYDQARETFEAWLAREPANTAAQTGEVVASEQIALQARAAGKQDDALRALLRAKDFVPRNERLLLDLGILEEAMHLYHDAEDALAAADAIHPGTNPLVLYAMARVKMDIGQLAAAEEKMAAYLKLKPDDASAHFGLGRIYQIGLQLDKAKGEFARSIELQPVQTEAYFELGDIALKQGDFPAAIEQFGKTLARDPHHGGALEESGEANYKMKRYDQAREFLERAVVAAPDYTPCHYYLGLTLSRLGRKDEAERELAIASKMADEQNRQSANQLRIIPQQRP